MKGKTNISKLKTRLCTRSNHNEDKKVFFFSWRVFFSSSSSSYRQWNWAHTQSVFVKTYLYVRINVCICLYVRARVNCALYTLWIEWKRVFIWKIKELVSFCDKWNEIHDEADTLKSYVKWKWRLSLGEAQLIIITGSNSSF